jgi:hypothetical protein
MAGISSADLQNAILENVSQLGQKLVGVIAGGLGNVASAITNGFIMGPLVTALFISVAQMLGYADDVQEKRQEVSPPI